MKPDPVSGGGLARAIYTLCFYLLLPLILLRLWWRGRREPEYRLHWRERLAWYSASVTNQAPVIWLHAVSVGETRAAQPLLEALLSNWPSATILLTHMTPTGRSTGAELFGRYGARLQQIYLPYDLPAMQQRFLRQFSPCLCILMETEVWPNLVAACNARGVPVALVNARLSPRSLRRAQRLRHLMLPAGRGLQVVGAQTEADAQRLLAMAAPQVTVTGSIKFDVAIPAQAIPAADALRQGVGGRPVFLCASTREGEEALLLQAFLDWRASAPVALASQILLLLVPRHPQRFDDVAQLIQQSGLQVQRRSQWLPGMSLAADTQVLLGDSMGEMFMYCALADAAFIGGSLLPLGGQNPIEACALGRPVLFGPHTFNFEWVCEQALLAGAASRVPDAAGVWEEAGKILQSPKLREQRGSAAQIFASSHRGATARTLQLLSAYLPERSQE